MTPEARAEMQREWMTLVQDIESAIGQGVLPASTPSRSPTRWLTFSRALQWRRTGLIRRWQRPPPPLSVNRRIGQEPPRPASAAVWDFVEKALTAR